MNDLPKSKTDSDLDVQSVRNLSLGSSNTVALVLNDTIGVNRTISNSHFQLG
jgi:hypothetical protein